MINFSYVDFAKVIMVFVLGIVQSLVKPETSHVSILNVGDNIDGMSLTTGAEDAHPLWAFCASREADEVITANCRVPHTSRLAIGHAFLPSNNVFQGLEGLKLTWALSIDNREINLDNFGAHDYVLPTLYSSPFFDRDVFMKFTGWDVVLINLQPGTHKITGHVNAGAEAYRWVVNLTIEDRSVSPEQSSKDPAHSDSPSGCPKSIQTLSKFHHSCKFYG